MVISDTTWDYVQSFEMCPLNTYKKKKKENKFDCKRKRKNILLSQLLFSFNTEKAKIMIFFVNFVS